MVKIIFFFYKALVFFICVLHCLPSIISILLGLCRWNFEINVGVHFKNVMAHICSILIGWWSWGWWLWWWWTSWGRFGGKVWEIHRCQSEGMCLLSFICVYFFVEMKIQEKKRARMEWIVSSLFSALVLFKNCTPWNACKSFFICIFGF